MKFFDVTIIGAGPGGLKCAETLGKSKFKVLLLEKNKEIGPKVCAGGLTNLDANFEIPKDKTRIFQKQEIHIKNKAYFTNLLNPLKTISRLDLGHYQVNKIRNCKNIKIITGASVQEIRKDEVITSKGGFCFKYLVGADGTNSIVRKSLGLKSKICMGIYYDIKRITSEAVIYFTPKRLKWGYIWVFPHQKLTNIGIYFDPTKITSKNAKEVLEDFLGSKGYDYHNNKCEAAPINYSYQGCIFGNIFLVGDAAGLTTKTTGEGISFALTSGSEIGQKILNPDYKMEELESILRFKKRQERMLSLFYLLPLMQTTFFKIFINLMKRKWFQTYLGN